MAELNNKLPLLNTIFLTTPQSKKTIELALSAVRSKYPRDWAELKSQHKHTYDGIISSIAMQVYLQNDKLVRGAKKMSIDFGKETFSKKVFESLIIDVVREDRPEGRSTRVVFESASDETLESYLSEYADEDENEGRNLLNNRLYGAAYRSTLIGNLYDFLFLMNLRFKIEISKDLNLMWARLHLNETRKTSDAARKSLKRSEFFVDDTRLEDSEYVEKCIQKIANEILPDLSVILNHEGNLFLTIPVSHREIFGDRLPFWADWIIKNRKNETHLFVHDVQEYISLYGAADKADSKTKPVDVDASARKKTRKKIIR